MVPARMVLGMSAIEPNANTVNRFDSLVEDLGKIMRLD